MRDAVRMMFHRNALNLSSFIHIADHRWLISHSHFLSRD